MTDLWLFLIFVAIALKSGYNYHADFTEIKDSIYSLRNSVNELRRAVEKMKGES